MLGQLVDKDGDQQLENDSFGRKLGAPGVAMMKSLVIRIIFDILCGNGSHGTTKLKVLNLVYQCINWEKTYFYRTL